MVLLSQIPTTFMQNTTTKIKGTSWYRRNKNCCIIWVPLRCVSAMNRGPYTFSFQQPCNKLFCTISSTVDIRSLMCSFVRLEIYNKVLQLYFPFYCEFLTPDKYSCYRWYFVVVIYCQPNFWDKLNCIVLNSLFQCIPGHPAILQRSFTFPIHDFNL